MKLFGILLITLFVDHALANPVAHALTERELFVPDAAIGAVAAASIGGLLAFLGLLVAKENKTSEFRQAWIDALRLDLAKMIANAKTMRAALVADFGDGAELFIAAERHIVEINQAAVAIKLRLNPAEQANVPILEGLDELSRLTLVTPPHDKSALIKCEEKIIVAAQVVLKNEWNRVRRGELIFFITKWAGLFVIILGLGWVIWMAFQSGGTTK
jgi:hypothetical protein